MAPAFAAPTAAGRAAARASPVADVAGGGQSRSRGPDGADTSTAGPGRAPRRSPAPAARPPPPAAPSDPGAERSAAARCRPAARRATGGSAPAGRAAAAVVGRAATRAPEPAATPAPATAPAAAPAPVAPTAAARDTFFGIYGDGVVLIDRDGNADWSPRLLGATLTHRPADWLRFHFDFALERAEDFGAQQALVEFSPHPAFGVHAGLMLLPLGIINRLFEPPTYLSVDRPLTDQLIIPTTWRELGVGIFGEIAGALRYEVDVVSALDSARFTAQAPLWAGRGNGDRLGIHQAAVTARVEVADLPGFACGAGGYYGPASCGEPMLDGVSVALVETDFRFRGAGFDLRAEYAHLFIFNSYRVNDYLGLLGQSAVPKNGRGGYVQAGYDLLHLGDGPSRQELVIFAAYENVNPRSSMSSLNYNPGTITGPGETPPSAPSPARQFVRGGLVYRPVPGLAFKARRAGRAVRSRARRPRRR